MAKRTIIVCPTSLVSNWDSEATKWLKVWRVCVCVRAYVCVCISEGVGA